MVIYVGVLFFGYQCQAFDPATKKYTRIDIYKGWDQKNYFNSLMRQIVTQIQGDLGGICFCLPYDYGEKTKQDIIFNATNFGFSKVKIIIESSVIFWIDLETSLYKPKNCDKIWIINQHILYLWQQSDNKLKCIQEFKIDNNITETTVTEIVKRIGTPNMVAYHFYQEIIGPLKVVFQKMLPQTFLFFTAYDDRKEKFMKYILKEAMSDNNTETKNEKVANIKLLPMNEKDAEFNESKKRMEKLLSDYDVITMDDLNL